MSATVRACPSCSAVLPEEAAFCHKCGTATPQGIDRETGEIRAATAAADQGQRDRLQRALGESCEVRRLLGRGGFAEVYLAYDKRLKREVAVKTLRADVVASHGLLERFQREAEAVAKLRHPNVVPIYTVGEGDGIAYYTMPLIEGDSLATVLDRDGPLPLDEACRILREAALALHAAHRAGIVHRDVKPENIMLEGAERSVVVMDFGIAKTAGPEEKGLTGTGMLIGTPQYMSPEQAAGERELDHRSDQYSLATVGYRMLAGRLPFEGASVQTQIFKTITETPRPVAELVPDVPTPISEAIAKGLAKRPDDRFPSMQAFAAEFAPRHGAVGAGSGTGSRRRRDDLATRVARMRAAMPGVRHPLLWLGAVAAVALALLTVATTPRAAIALANARDDALFVARAALGPRANAGSRPAYATLFRNDSVFRFLYGRLGFDEAERRAASDVAVWEWAVTFPGRDSRDHWRVFVGPRNRVTGYRHIVADTAAAVAIPVDSARRLAERDVAARGWPLAGLQPLRDSAVTRKARTDYLFRWRVRDGAVPWRGADSAYTRVGATVIGDRVDAFSEQFRVPESFSRRGEAEYFGAVLFFLFLALGGAAVATVIRAQRTDDLQWKVVGRYVAATVVVAIVATLPRLVESLALSDVRQIASPNSGSFVGLLFVLAVFAGLMLFTGVAGESLAQESRPGVLAGLDDLSRGRFAVPELVPAAARGYAFGALIALGSPLASFASLRLHVGEPRLYGLAFTGAPVLGQLEDLAALLLALPVLLFVTALVARTPRISRFAVVVPAAVVGVLSVLAGAAVTTTVTGVVVTLLLTYALWRFDVLTALVALVVAAGASNAAVLLQTGTARYLWAGAAMVLLALAPAAVAFVAYRRWTRVTESGENQR